MPIPAYLWHPIFVHFSVALLTVATVFYLLAALFPGAIMRTRWVLFANWNLWGGFGVSVLTVLLGWLAFNTVSHDDVSHEAMKVHATLALVTLCAFGVLTAWSLLRRKSSANPPWLFTVFLLAAFGFLIATGVRGGELVFHYGLAVSALPKSESDEVGTATPAGPTEHATANRKEAAPPPHHHRQTHSGKDHVD